jgi:O-antigen/teichoic acid export membrane protein
VKLFSATFAPAASVVPVLAAASVLYGIAHLSRVGNVAIGRRREIAVIAGIALAANAAMNAVAIPRWSYTGAAWTTLVTEVLEAALLLGVFAAAVGIPRLGKAGAVPLLAAGAIAAALGASGLRDGRGLLVVVLGYPLLLALTAAAIAPNEARRARRLLLSGRPDPAPLEVPY